MIPPSNCQSPHDLSSYPSFLLPSLGRISYKLLSNNLFIETVPWLLTPNFRITCFCFVLYHVYSCLCTTIFCPSSPKTLLCSLDHLTHIQSDRRFLCRALPTAPSPLYEFEVEGEWTNPELTDPHPDLTVYP